MATFDYGKSQATVRRLLDKFGTVCEIIRWVAPDGSTPWEPGEPVEHKFSARVAMLPASKGTIEAFDIRLDENLIMQNVRFGIMETQMTKLSGPTGLDSITPKPTDNVIVNGETLTVLGCTPLSPSGIPVYFPFAGKV